MAETTEILFDKFEILEILKKDEHAAVYLANHIYLSKKIILKILNTQKISDQALIERFKREAKLLARLDHPNIIKVLDFGTSKEYFYISFEYIEGDSLRNLLKSRILTDEEKKHLMIQLFKALHFAHSNQIIHRDIKPENIFVDHNMNLKLGDFGLALSAEDNFITSPYSIVGTPSYMSPEQVTGAKLTFQSDLFSAGVVIYELFTGKNPFVKENVTLTLNEIMSYNENNIAEGLTDVPQEIREILIRLLKKKPAQRYNSALDVLKELGVQTDQVAISIDKEPKKEKQLNVKSILFAVASLALLILFILSMNKFQLNKLFLPEQTINQPKLETPKSITPKNKGLAEQTKIDSSVISVPTKEKQLLYEGKENSKQMEVRYGALFVECSPWADVYIDGEKVETTPLNKPLTLIEGEHTLKLVHPDYPVYSNVIKIDHSKVTNIRVSLESLMGYINCRVNPWGNIYINGNYKGQTPLKELIRVFPGFIRLTITNPNYKDIDTSFNIKQGDTLQLKFVLKEK